MGSPEQLTTQQIRTQAWLQSLSQPPVLTLQHLQVMGDGSSRTDAYVSQLRGPSPRPGILRPRA